MAIGYVAVPGRLCGLGARGGHSPRLHGCRDRAGCDRGSAYPHVPLLRLVCGFSLLLAG